MSQNPIVQSVSNWVQRTFSTSGALGLFFTLVFVLIVIECFGSFLMPVFVSVVLAYLLDSVVRGLVCWRCPRGLAVMVVYGAFLGLFLCFVFGLLPAIWRQASTLTAELPGALSKGQDWGKALMAHYPQVFSVDAIHHVMTALKAQAGMVGHHLLQFSVSTISNLVTVVLYLVLVPLLVLFFLKDSAVIVQWFGQYMPKDNSLVLQVWSEVNAKIAAYIRGRVLEILIVSGVSAVVFALMGLPYAVLLGSLLGVSVIIPYIGAVIATVPIVIVALMSWGASSHFVYFMLVYVALIILDGYVLVPLLFAETMNLHPVVIILSVIVFGGIWGFWGVFFAIPLATLANVVLRSWPRSAS